MISIGYYEYRQKDIIGSGGFGKVFLGRDIQTRQQVAIKVINNYHLEQYQRREIDNLRGLKCKNIVRLLDYRTISGNVYVIMELCIEDMEDRINNIGRDFEEPEIRNFIRQTATGLQYIHDNDIVHRDIKPANILYVRKSKKIIYKISDFGISKMIEGTHRMTIIGTPIYMAPEIRRNQPASFNSDIWSLGKTVCFMITRNVNNLNYRDEVSDDLEDLLYNMLINNPRDRMNADDVLNHDFITIY